jgi:hypothetical protein
MCVDSHARSISLRKEKETKSRKKTTRKKETNKITGHQGRRRGTQRGEEMKWNKAGMAGSVLSV